MKTNAKIKLLSFFVMIIIINNFLLIFSTKSAYAISSTTSPEITNSTQTIDSNNINSDIQADTNSTSENTLQQITNNELKIYSDAVIVIENRTGKILYEKNSDKRMYPASTTKILTAILAIEKGNLSDKTTVSRSAIAEMKPSYSSADLIAGEVISVENLLEVLLVHSANDASNVLAEYISGSISEFVNLMNAKLQELGCTNTHFVTTNGLHDDNHYSTAKDMATIARYCMRNSIFRKIVGMKKCVIPPTNKSEERVYKNTNDLIINTSIYYYPGCLGIKTGFTSQAKNCLISACSKNNLQTIAVVLGASVTEKNRSARYEDSKTLYDYAYKNYAFSKIAAANTIAKTLEINNGTQETKKLDLLLQNDITALVKKGDYQNIMPSITLKNIISAPISQNEILGTITYTIDGENYSTNLIASHNVEKVKPIVKKIIEKKDNTKVIILTVLLAVTLLIVFLIFIIIILKHSSKKEHSFK